MRFLRHSKYCLVRATEELKYYLSFPKRYPECFGSFDVHESKFLAIVDSDCALFMPEVDADGCRIVVFHAAYLDTDNISFVDLQRLFFTFEEIAANMEEAQIAGVKLIIDYSNVTIKFFNWPKLKDYVRVGEVLKSPLWVRLKAIYLLNLPSFADHIIKFIMKFASEKMKERIKFIMNKSELEDHTDVNLLLEEYGGKVSIEQSQKYLKKLLGEMQDKILLLDQIDADFEEIDIKTFGSSEFEFGAIGSFKKLEID